MNKNKEIMYSLQSNWEHGTLTKGKSKLVSFRTKVIPTDQEDFHSRIRRPGSEGQRYTPASLR